MVPRAHDLRLVPRQARFRTRASSGGGVTLLELLVVVMIVLVISAIVLRNIVPAIASRGVREGARILTVMISSARNRALETGRSTGIWIERMPNRPEAATSIAFASTPEPYCGDFFDSTLEGWIEAKGTYFVNRVEPTYTSEVWGSGASPLTQQFIRSGDELRVGFRPQVYTLLSTAATEVKSYYPSPVWIAGYWTSAPSQNPIVTKDASDNRIAQPFSYQISRQPVKMSSGQVQMPDDVVIDLNYSGPTMRQSFHPRTNGLTNGKDYAIGEPQYPDDTTPIVIMFTPAGNVESVYCRRWDANVPGWVWAKGTQLESAYFLIGQASKVPVDSTRSQTTISATTLVNTNLADPTNLWLMLSPAGHIASANNYMLPATSYNANVTTSSAGDGLFVTGWLVSTEATQTSARRYIFERSNLGSQ